MMEAIDNWHKTKVGHLTFGVAELLLAYLFASLAINSGRLLEYAITFILFIGAVQNFVRIFKTTHNDRKRR